MFLKGNIIDFERNNCAYFRTGIVFKFLLIIIKIINYLGNLTFNFYQSLRNA